MGHRWDEGKNYVVTRILDENGDRVGTYCDICSPVAKNGDGYEFEDWYLDVWQPANQTPGLLDEDELEEAVNEGHITPQQDETAREAAAQLIALLASNASAKLKCQSDLHGQSASRPAN